MEKIEWKDWFYYDETSPTCLRWKVNMTYGKWNQSVNRYAGDVAGTVAKRGGHAVGLFRVNRKVHRIIYEMFSGTIPKDQVVDHMDGNSLNNRIENLRATSHYYNSCNCKMSKNNTSGVTGVCMKNNKCGNSYYVARWTELDGKERSKVFSINKLGIMVAFREAVIYRQKSIAELNLQGAGYTERHGKT